MITEKGIEKVAKAIVDLSEGKKTKEELELVMITALGIPHPSVILKVDPKWSSEENMEAFKKAWKSAMLTQGKADPYIKTLGEDGKGIAGN